MKNLKILIIEDEEELLKIYRESAEKIFPVISCARNLQEAGDFLAQESFDCILLDNKLPDGLGISFVKKMNLSEKKHPIVMITAYADKDLAIDSVNAGIFYFLEKPISRQKLLETLQKCFNLSIQQNMHKEMEKLYYISQKTANYLRENKNITEREIEIISCVLLNDKNPDIAEKLFISPGTVKRHLHNIFEKVKLSSREELQELIHKLNTEITD